MQTAQTLPEQPKIDQRVAGLLAAVRVAFAEKGFDGASMQDLARAAGISVGNFYRYFPSKAAIVDQLIAHDLAQVEQDFHTILTAPDPLQNMRTLLRGRLQRHQAGIDGPLWAEITAAASRKPEIGCACQHMEAAIASYMTQAFALVTGLPVAESQRRFSAHAALIIMLVKSAAMMVPQQSPARGDLNALIMRIIDELLDEVASATVKG